MLNHLHKIITHSWTRKHQDQEIGKKIANKKPIRNLVTIGTVRCFYFKGPSSSDHGFPHLKTSARKKVMVHRITIAIEIFVTLSKRGLVSFDEDTAVEDYNAQFNEAGSWYHDHVEDESGLFLSPCPRGLHPLTPRK